MFSTGLSIPDKLVKTDLRLDIPTRSYGHLSHLRISLSPESCLRHNSTTDGRIWLGFSLKDHVFALDVQEVFCFWWWPTIASLGALECPFWGKFLTYIMWHIYGLARRWEIEWKRFRNFLTHLRRPRSPIMSILGSIFHIWHVTYRCTYEMMSNQMEIISGHFDQTNLLRNPLMSIFIQFS
jgi:hypothetical protein